MSLIKKQRRCGRVSGSYTDSARAIPIGAEVQPLPKKGAPRTRGHHRDTAVAPVPVPHHHSMYEPIGARFSHDENGQVMII